MKQIIQKLWIFVVMLCVSLSVSAYDFEVDGLYYELSSLSNRTCKLTSGKSTYSGSLIIPESVNYDGLVFSVTEIDAKAFNSNITELSIPASIITIPNGSIRRCKLTKLTFQDGKNPLWNEDYVEKAGSTYGPTYGQPLQYLYIGRTLTGYGSFSHSSSLTEIIIGPCVTKMPSFHGSNKLESVYIPDNVISLEGGSLEVCLGLKTVYIGNGVSKIPNWFFNGCTALENVYIGNNVSEIGGAVFRNCKKLTNLFIFSDKLTTIADNTSDGINDCLPKSISKIYVPSPSRYDNLLNGYYRENLISLNNPSTEYSGKLPDFSYKNNVTGANISFSSLGLSCSVGSYNLPINVIFTFNNGWSTTSEVATSYTINLAPLTVIANDASRKYGMTNPEFSFSFFGFKNGETADVLTRMPNVETTATISSNVGTYPIIPSGAEAQNYTFNYERGTLTITKADQTIEWEQSFGSINVGDVIELTATSSANLPIKYTATDETIAEIFTQGGKKYVEFLKPGTVSIRAAQEGNENYNEADRVSKSIKVDLLTSGISLNQNSATLAEGKSLQLTATVTPANASNKTLIWESANPGVATVDANGKVVAISQGSTVITVKTTDGSNISAQCEIKVVKLVDGIKLNLTTVTLTEGQSLLLEATISPILATNKTIVWSSDNEAVATASQQGKITAISKGSAVITAKSTDGSGITASCSVNVVKLVSGIVLSETEMTLNEGQSAQLIAIVSSDANNKTLAWSSSNEDVATVSKDGNVTAVSKGVAVITVKATDGSNVSASCTVNVIKIVSGITLSESELTLNEGESAQLSATITPELANNKTLLWTSSNEAVAVVSETGKVTAISKGSAIITAKATDGSNVSASCVINVVKLIASISLSQTKIDMEVGQRTSITAQINPINVSNPTLWWYSENDNVATVEDGVVTAVGVGRTYIVVESTDGSDVKEKCEVVVEASTAIGTISTNNVNVYVSNRIINIDNVPINVPVNIFLANGTLVNQEISTGKSITYQPSSSGIYIILVGTQSYKVVIR